MNISTKQVTDVKILASVLAAKILPEIVSKALIAKLKEQPELFAVVLASIEAFDKPELKRLLNLAKPAKTGDISWEPDFLHTQVNYQGQNIGEIKVLLKSPLPGELQARLAIESAIDRFLEYLQKVYQIVVIDESDRHVQLFIPNKPDYSSLDFAKLWQDFLEQVAFSAYGLQQYRLPGLVQTFIAMLRSVTLSGRGFSTLEIPILTRDQANILTAWYFAVWRETKKRQDDRQKKINTLKVELEVGNLTDKERQSEFKLVQDAEAMQAKELEKYKDNFQKSFGKLLEEQKNAYNDLKSIQTSIQEGLSKADLKKLQKQRDKLEEKLIFLEDSINQKIGLLNESEGNPLEFVLIDKNKNKFKFSVIEAIARNFDKTSTDQINGTRGDIFAQCIAEMYRLLEMTDEQFDQLPLPLLTENPEFHLRSPGDDNKEFCYACGIALDPKTAKWQVLRFMFERPSQRRQSASGEGRPHICSSCAALAFASPLKVTDESIILRLESADSNPESSLKLKDYLRMLTSKQMHLYSGRYIVLASEKTQGGDSSAQKMGQVQYALAKVASIFEVEVIQDFRFSLIIQGGEYLLANRHLIFIKGLMECYGQSIIIAGKDFNLSLGDAIRYVQQDLVYLADYSLTKIANFSNDLELEKIRSLYWDMIQNDLKLQGDSMDSDVQLSKRARLYRHVAALTGLTYAFASSMENTLKGKDKDDREREIGKLIEQVEDASFFCYYATLGVETSVRARLWKNVDNYFIYEQAKNLLVILGQENREESDKSGRIWLNFYADDINNAYTYFAENGYGNDKEWKELTYSLKLSLYTRFPELVRKLKNTGDK